MVKIGNDWDRVLDGEFDKEYYLKLREFLKEEYKSHTVYPDMYDIFNALKYTPYKDVKVVILGQDPYHEPGQAHGLSFSVQKGITPPPSLVNIYKEIIDEYGITMPKNYGCLTRWGKTRGFAFKHNPYRTCPYGKQPQQCRLADFHRRCDKKIKPARKAHGVYTLGQKCHKQAQFN